MENKKVLVPRKYLLTFILITSLFYFWHGLHGFYG